MKEFKGTPGPWLTLKHYEDCLIVVDERGYEIAQAEKHAILNGYRGKLGIEHWADDERAIIELSDEEQTANAYLIAAAPELLEALQECLPWVNNGIARGAHNKAIAAINKALGK